MQKTNNKDAVYHKKEIAIAECKNLSVNEKKIKILPVNKNIAWFLRIFFNSELLPAVISFFYRDNRR